MGVVSRNSASFALNVARCFAPKSWASHPFTGFMVVYLCILREICELLRDFSLNTSIKLSGVARRLEVAKQQNRHQPAHSPRRPAFLSSSDIPPTLRRCRPQSLLPKPVSLRLLQKTKSPAKPATAIPRPPQNDPSSNTKSTNT